MDPDTAAHFAYTLQLHFENGHLHIVDTLRDSSPVMLLYNAMLQIMVFKQFTTSRWLTMGHAARTIIALHLLGFGHFVAYINTETHESMFFLNGYARLNEDVMKLFAAVCFVSRPTDTVLALLLEDGRVCRQLRAIREALISEMDSLADVPEYVWSAVAEVAGMSTHELRDQCMSGAHISV